MKKNHYDNVRKESKIEDLCCEEGEVKEDDEQGRYESGAKVPGSSEPINIEDIADNAM